jgi:sugar phosphate isomerase/epimerase
MKIGCSVYSFRKEFQSKKYAWTLETFKILKATYPEIAGWEIISDFIDQYWKGSEPKDLLNLQSALKQVDFDWFAVTTPSGAFGQANLVPHWVDDAHYIEGFKRGNDFILGYAEEWIENTASLGIKLMRIDCAPLIMDHKINYSMAFDFNVNRNIDNYRQICAMAKEHGIAVGIENHGGFASDPKVLKKLMDAVPDLYLTYDVGNVTDANRFPMLEDYAERINFVHAKTHVFNEFGDEQYLDFKRVIGTLKDKGFDGWLSIEFEGPTDGDTGVRKTIDLLKKYL